MNARFFGISSFYGPFLNIQGYIKVLYIFVKFAFITLCKIFEHSILFQNCLYIRYSLIFLQYAKLLNIQCYFKVVCMFVKFAFITLCKIFTLQKIY